MNLIEFWSILIVKYLLNHFIIILGLFLLINYKLVCQLFRIGVAALFGPSSETTSHYVQSMSEAIRIPHVDYETRSQSNSWPSELAVNVHPHFASLSRVINWEFLITLYNK